MMQNRYAVDLADYSKLPTQTTTSTVIDAMKSRPNAEGFLISGKVFNKLMREIVTSEFWGN